MNKIPTLFVRDEVTRKVTPAITPGCEFVTECIPTEKLDGTNVRLTIRNGAIVRIEKRKNGPKGVDPWYTDTDQNNPSDKHIISAAQATKTAHWPDGEHCCEAVGPDIQGNPLGLNKSYCYPFKLFPILIDLPKPWTFDSIRAFLKASAPMEGIVFHHPDGRMCKIKTKDFPV